jgi:group I intron endonuclease
MIATAFLGYHYSPKWSKFNNNQYKNNNRLFLYQKLNKFNLTTKRYNSSLASPIVTAPITKRVSGGVGCSFSNQALPSDRPSQRDGLYCSKTLTDFLNEKNLKSVYSYENLELDSTKKKIQSETRNLSGIYLILNKITLDYYVGSASTNKFYARFSNHLFNLNGSKIIKAAVRKYKISEFAFIVLELFPEVVTKENNKNLLDLEDFYLKSLLPNYNILTEAGSSFGYKHTEITRIKMKSNYSMERRLKVGNLNKGKNLSEETKERIREKALIREKPFY